MAATKKRGPGQPTKFRRAYVRQVFHLALLGATEPDLARAFGVAHATVKLWMGAHPDFRAALKRGRATADANVGRSLYHRAIGYSHPAEKIAFDKSGATLRADYVERYPPDATACIFWLKNRRPDLWSDRQVRAHENADGSPFALNVIIESGRPTAAAGDGSPAP